MISILLVISEKMFHKKCTDRRRLTQNWSKKPWFCHHCILGETRHTNLPNSENNREINNVADSNNDDNLVAHTLNPSVFEFFPPQPGSAHGGPGQAGPAQADAAQQAPQHAGPVQQPALVHQPGPVQLAPLVPRFPTNHGRQKGTNINLNNPEMEFQKTSLNACRSTIATQQAELKRPNECLSVRNRRVMQLEDQVKFASETIADRDPYPSSDNEARKNIEVELSRLSSILDSINVPGAAGAISKTIYIHPSGSVTTIRSNQHTQTESENIPSCKKCEENSKNNCNLSMHYALNSETIGSINCDHCSSKLPDNSRIEHHIQNNHGEAENDPGQSLSMCETCGVFFEDEMSLQTHIDDSHIHMENCEDSGVLSPSDHHPTISSPPAMDTRETL